MLCYDSLPSHLKKMFDKPDGRLILVDSIILKKLTIEAASSEGVTIPEQQLNSKNIYDQAELYEQTLKHDRLAVSDAEVIAFKNELSKRQLSHVGTISGDRARQILLNQRFDAWLRSRMLKASIKRNQQAIDQLHL